MFPPLSHFNTPHLSSRRTVLSFFPQSPELEFRHELMGRINKLESDVELDVVPINQHHPSSSSPLPQSTLSGYGPQGYDYGKEFFFGKYHSAFQFPRMKKKYDKCSRDLLYLKSPK